MRAISTVHFFFVTLLTTQSCTAPCNGDVALCGRSVRNVVFPSTHNANAAEEYGYSTFNANQSAGIATQLEDGIRGLLLDVTYYQDETTLCHGLCDLGSTPHVDTLRILKDFMNEHPREVIVLLYQDSISVDDLENDFAESELIDLVHSQTGDDWPTLETMIRANRRLVVTTEVAKGPPDWIHHLWDVAWDTPYSFTDTEDFRCELNRGESTHPLYLMNHWLGTQYGLPSKEKAAVANGFETLHARALDCWQQSGQIPNFVAVDWYRTGDLFEVVQTLNDAAGE